MKEHEFVTEFYHPYFDIVIIKNLMKTDLKTCFLCMKECSRTIIRAMDHVCLERRVFSC